jgi:holo-[acyl-carrier protein] synthase
MLPALKKAGYGYWRRRATPLKGEMQKIIGTGIDVIELKRIRAAIERHGGRFLKKVYTPAEAAYCQSKKDCWASFAARWAAKEAVYKAYGSGWWGVWWLNQIEVTRQPSGKPGIKLLGTAAKAQANRGVLQTELSLTHGRDVAIASVILWGDAEK